MKTATATEIEEAARSRSMLDSEQDRCCPHHSFLEWTDYNRLWIATTYDEVVIVRAERPLAKKLYTKVYLHQQGWQRFDEKRRATLPTLNTFKVTDSDIAAIVEAEAAERGE